MDENFVIKNETEQKRVRLTSQKSIAIDMNPKDEENLQKIKKIPPLGRTRRQNSLIRQPSGFGSSLISRQKTIQESGLSVFTEMENDSLSRKPSFETYSKADIQKALDYIESLKNTVRKKNSSDPDASGSINIEADDPEDVIELKECIKELETINKKIEAYDTYLKKKPLNYNGYNEIKVPHMPKELKKKLVEAVTKGDINEVEYLLNEPEADLNMTWFSENLLMIAIRSGQEPMAEYLIAMGINVSHEIQHRQLKEEKLPICYYKYSCRDMAFDKELYNIIHLIDIFSDNTDDRIVKYLGAKYLERNLKTRPELARDSDASFKFHFKNEFENVLHDDNIRDDISEKLDPTKETEYLKELEDVKPNSGYGYRYDTRSIYDEKSTIFGNDSKTVKFSIPDPNVWDGLTSQSISTASLGSINAYNKNFVNNNAPTKARSQKLLAQNILARIKHVTKLSQSCMSRQTIASAQSAAQQLEATQSESPRSKSTSRLATSRTATSRTDTSRLDSRTESRRAENNQDETDDHPLESRIEFPSNKPIPKPSVSPRKLNLKQSIELSKSLNIDDGKFYVKTNDTIKSMDDRSLLKQVKKIRNHRFLSIVSQMPENKQIIESSLKKYNEPMLPVILNLRQANLDGIQLKSNSSPGCQKLPYLKKQING